MTSHPPKSTVMVFRTAAVLTLIAVIGGAVVCATDSGFECGTWPGCGDDSFLPVDPVVQFLYKNPWIEMTHRASAVLAGPFAMVAGIMAARMKDVHKLVKILPWVTVLGALIAGFVGRGIVLGVQYPTWVGAADLGAALLAAGAILVATVALERTPTRWRPGPVATFSWAAVATLFTMHLLSLWAAGAGSYTRCMSWPVWTAVPGDDVVLNGVRMALALIGLGFIVAAVAVARRRPELKAVGITVAILTVIVLTGSALIGFGHLMALAAFYSTATVLLMAALALLGARDSLRTMPGSHPESLPRVEAEVTARP